MSSIAGFFVEPCLVFVWIVASVGMLDEGNWKLCGGHGRGKCIFLCDVRRSEFRSRSGIYSRDISRIDLCEIYLEACVVRIGYVVGRGI